MMTEENLFILNTILHEYNVKQKKQSIHALLISVNILIQLKGNYCITSY